MNVVYGGSFNPPTKAHEYIAKYIINNYDVENFIFLPVGSNYQKNSLTKEIHRYNMLKIVTKNIDKAIVLDTELGKEFKGTYVSLKELSKKYNDLYFVMGADNIASLDNWLNLDKLLNEFNFFIISRDNIDINNIIKKKFMKYKDKFIIINIDIDINSSRIRNNINEYKNDLNCDVYKYILENKIYEGE